jgi:hypothetical protein
MNVLKILISSLFIYTLSFANLIDKNLYEKLGTPALDKNVLARALEGMSEIDVKRKNIITIIDYTKSSNEKRLFIIDLKKEKIIFDTYVSHGMNTGGEYAVNFSNRINSKQSSVGFFETSNTYMGINGYSMRLDGLEKGINDKARVRNIVFHGADYVAKEYIKKNGRLGRSWGCPVVPLNLTKEIINTIKNGSLVYINGDLANYEKKSKYITF